MKILVAAVSTLLPLCIVALIKLWSDVQILKINSQTMATIWNKLDKVQADIHKMQLDLTKLIASHNRTNESRQN